MVMLKTGPTGDYREQILRHPAVYVDPTTSTDFYQNAVNSANPMNPTRGRVDPYDAGGVTASTWNQRLQEQHIQQ